MHVERKQDSVFISSSTGQRHTGWRPAKKNLTKTSKVPKEESLSPRQPMTPLGVSTRVVDGVNSDTTCFGVRTWESPKHRHNKSGKSHLSFFALFSWSFQYWCLSVSLWDTAAWITTTKAAMPASVTKYSLYWESSSIQTVVVLMIFFYDFYYLYFLITSKCQQQV